MTVYSFKFRFIKKAIEQNESEIGKNTQNKKTRQHIG